MKITLQVPFTCLMLSLSHVSFNVFEKMWPFFFHFDHTFPYVSFEGKLLKESLFVVDNCAPGPLRTGPVI